MSAVYTRRQKAKERIAERFSFIFSDFKMRKRRINDA